MNKNPNAPTSREPTIVSSPTRRREPTLVGVAPAAPVITGRPASAPSHAGANAPESTRSDRHDANDAPPSHVRPQLEEPSESRADAEPVDAPKQTFDAISVGDAPAIPARRSGRTIAIVAVCALATGAIIAVIALRHTARPEGAIVTPAASPVAATTEPPPPASVQTPPASSVSAAPPTPKKAIPAKKPSPKHRKAPVRRH